MEKQFHSPNIGQPDSSGSQIDLEQLLKDGNIIRIHPQGYSMYPLFLPGRDEALIESVCADACKKNDVVLYRRDSGILVLHRICRITDNGFYLVGDNQREVEGPRVRLRSSEGWWLLSATERNLRPPAVLPFSFFPVALSSAGAPALFPPVAFFAPFCVHEMSVLQCFLIAESLSPAVSSPPLPHPHIRPTLPLRILFRPAVQAAAIFSA